MGYPGLSCSPTAGMEAGPSFPQEVGMTVGTVFSRNECSVIDCSAVGTQTGMGNEWGRGGGGGSDGRQKGTHAESERPTSG